MENDEGDECYRRTPLKATLSLSDAQTRHRMHRETLRHRTKQARMAKRRRGEAMDLSQLPPHTLASVSQWMLAVRNPATPAETKAECMVHLRRLVCGDVVPYALLMGANVALQNLCLDTALAFAPHAAANVQAYHITFNALWVINNLVSWEDPDCVAFVNTLVLQDDLLNKLIALTKHCVEIDGLLDLLVWIMGNLATDSPKTKRLMASHKDIRQFLLCMTEPTSCLLRAKNPKFLSNLLYALSSLFKPDDEKKNADPSTCPLASFAFQCTPFFASIAEVDSEETLFDVVWGIFYISEYDCLLGNLSTFLQKFWPIITRELDRVTPQNQRMDISEPCLKLCSNFLSGPDSLTVLIVENGILPYLMKIAMMNFSELQHEAVFALSNVCAIESPAICVSLTKFPGFIEFLVKTFAHSLTPLSIRKEAIVALANLLDKASDAYPELVASVLDYGLGPAISEALEAYTEIGTLTLSYVVEALTSIYETKEGRENLVLTEEALIALQDLSVLTPKTRNGRELREQATYFLERFPNVTQESLVKYDEDHENLSADDQQLPPPPQGGYNF